MFFLLVDCERRVCGKVVYLGGDCVEKGEIGENEKGKKKSYYKGVLLFGFYVGNCSLMR